MELLGFLVVASAGLLVVQIKDQRAMLAVLFTVLGMLIIFMGITLKGG